MTAHVIKDPTVTINAVDLTDHVTEIEISQSFEDVDTTFAGGGGKRRIAGLEDASLTVNFNQDYDAGEVDATIYALLGSAVAFAVQPFAGSVTATNPSFRGTVVITEYKPIMGAVGSKNELSVTWPVDGKVSRHTS